MNTTSSETVKEKSPYKRGADDGFLMGILLIAVFLVTTWSITFPPASWIGMLLTLVAVPLTTFFMLRRSYLRDNGLTIFSSLWMQGIVMFFCGTIILALFVYIYLRILNPTFIVDMLNHVAGLYEDLGTDQGKQIASALHAMIKQNLVPSAISMALETIWVGVFTGSLLSALMAGMVKMKIWRQN